MVNNELIDASLLTENDGKIAYKIEKIEAYNERLDLYIKDLKQDYIKKSYWKPQNWEQMRNF